MGFLNNLMAALGGSGPTCPACGGPLDSNEMPPNRYWCESCSRPVVRYAGELVVPEPGDGLIQAVAEASDDGDAGESCLSCQASLSGGERWLPWERGDNAEAIIECPSCGYENTRYGFGE